MVVLFHNLKNVLKRKDHYIEENDDYTEFVTYCCDLIDSGFTFNDDLLVSFRKFIGNERLGINGITKNILIKYGKKGVKRGRSKDDQGNTKRGLAGLSIKKYGENF